MHRPIWVLSVIAIVTAIGVGFLWSPLLPAEMPSHWNSAGEVDGWQSTTSYILTLPIMTFVFVVVLAIMAARLTDARVRPYIAWSAAVFTVYMLSLHVLIGVRAFAGEAMTLAEFMRLLAGLFVGLAWIIKDVPPNHIAGFRFPWTLYDPAIWRHTHIVGFWGMFVGGVICAIVTVIPVATESMFGLGIGAILLGTIIPSVYSYWYARRMRSNH